MKLNDNERKRLAGFVLSGLRDGSAVQVPYALLTSYKALKLGEQEVMLLLHLLAYADKERNEFPTIEELLSRMTVAAEAVIASLQKLLKLGLLEIEEREEAATGILYERYNLDPLFERLAEVLADERLAAEEAALAALEAGKRGSGAASAGGPEGGAASPRNMFSVFESEFGRPLTPMELETISAWIDRDKYKEELILAALKEAVFSGKLHFRYIDRILLEWSRNRIQTVEQAREYTQRFRGGAARG
ncbi:DnaD domain-containing protein [Paenibacillus chartarius]|uniref:DnaD domain-containing protein n=1 Tax=Paenibacillus chartarius TaxID=747481 RepID=A0ABV6DQ86_9BACL